MTTIRCWQCGVEPDDVIEDWPLCKPGPIKIYNWPSGDHTHAATPPTPEQLAADSHTTWRRIMETP
ncbi:hypothetical protein AB0L22_08910 [Micromonospora haikouensis]|uniref:hypothetical protein n=1 Tax=Micromonospora haikouensis TaxID=686309 RepID=UPI00343C26DA